MLMLMNHGQSKTRALEEFQSSRGDLNADHEIMLREKDEEIEIYKSGMEQALTELEELKLVCTAFSLCRVSELTFNLQL